ncbi:FKBP-type peptidyl-prolyl cis-trans isomerase, partial [Pedobacter sp. HMWF019]|uniref:FKBP-type peptidyl-prolyl cis-trans isomerase n=1 Tax=Pedobacter sp. HMWF019 TaxID=2056856 RepID=UPI003515A3D6
FTFASMMRRSIKQCLLMLCLAGCLAACSKSNNDVPEVDQAQIIAQFKADTTAIRAFVKANNLTEMKKDEGSGIFYQVIAPGSGSVTYSASTQITADYTGRLLNGTVFETTTGKTPATFALGNVIAGWQFGIQKIQKDGKIRLIIPSYFAYGNVIKGSIPANSVLDFDITLNNVQ